MTPQALKASILQLAIQGKLFPQRPEEGTAEELYQQIQAEKQRLIANGTIKREKALPPIKEDEIPFDIPETWKWVRLGEILLKLTDGTHKTPKYSSCGIPFISVKNISDGKLSFSNTKFITEAEHQELYKRCNPEYGDILLSKVGTTGVPAIVNTHQAFSLFVSVALLKFNITRINNRYIYNLLQSPLVQEQARENTRGVGNKNWVLDAISNTVIPLPPLEEQKRIVAKIEEMLPLIDRYGEAYTELETFNKRFPDDLRKSILQEAIQGKLVPQLPEEGTAEELYQQIQAEKQRLIAAGTIKKEKPLPPIEEKDLPFDIPETWKWVRLGDCISLQSGQDLTPQQYNDQQKGIPYITGASNIEENRVLINRWTEGPKSYALKGDLLISCKGTIGKMAILTEEKVHIARQIMGIKPIMTSTQYIQFFLEQKIPTFKQDAKSFIPGIERNTILTTLIPLPPLAEQKRIVAKIEELLTLCKSMQ